MIYKLQIAIEFLTASQSVALSTQTISNCTIGNQLYIKQLLRCKPTETKLAHLIKVGIVTVAFNSICAGSFLQNLTYSLKSSTSTQIKPFSVEKKR